MMELAVSRLSTEGNGMVSNSLTRPGDARWVEQSFSKRDCTRYVASTKDASRCACGQTWAYHKTHGVECVGDLNEIWSPSQHTISSATDAFGTIDFLGGPHPNKAQFIRLGFDTRPELILQLLTREWGLELPKLIISVHGGKANFELKTRLKRVLRKGLLRAAKTTGAWILTGGTNTGVTRHVGDALISERSPRLRGGRVVSIGIAPWGIVENRASLVGRKKDVTYLSIDQPRSKFAVLNNRHAYFLLADNGTVGRYGAEIALRRKLEKYISSQRLPARTYCSIPVVCLVVEGGMHTIRTVLEYVTDSPPVPVVVVEGSGRAADLIAFAHKYATESGESSALLDGMREQLLAAIQRAFSVDQHQSEKLLSELLQCVRKKDLITIFRASHSATTADGEGNELDHAILSALFKARHLSAAEQLCLALAWNRVDIARSEIFVYGQEWSDGALEEAMMEALVKNRVDFVKLLLEIGVQMNKFLTIPRLEELYNSKQGPANTLRYIVRDVRPHMPRNYSYTLIDIGLVMNKLMGGAYRSSYTRRKFRHIYTVLMKKPRVTSFTQSALARVYSNHVLRNGNGVMGNSLLEDSQYNAEMSGNLFAQPFNELLVWSVLTKRQAMAKLMWHHGEEALAKALVASKLYRAMASEAADDDLEVEIFDELRSYAAEFDREAVELLDYCYRQDDDLAQQLLTCELSNWSRQTCLRLAFACHHRELLAHACSQLILGDLWLGGLRTRRSTNLKVVLGLLCPPLILRLEFKSKEELQLMPQTEEEHMIDLKDERDNDTRTDQSSTSSASSSPSGSPRSERSLSLRRASVAADEASPTAIEQSVSGKDIIHETTDPSIMYERRRMRQLRIKKKFYEFYGAPITDAFFVLEFFLAMIFRLHEDTLEIGRVLYCLNIVYWYIRILRILQVSKFLGPFVTMIGRMLEKMMYYITLMLVVLMSYGVFRQSVFFPYNEFRWESVRDIFFKPYFMIYGELFADFIDPPCNNGTLPDDPDIPPCGSGRWLNPLLMTCYLLVANILLLNLLIAVFNSIFIRTNVFSHQIWKFNRFNVVMEYEQKPSLPPPLIIFSHLHLIVKWCHRRSKGMIESYDYGLKLFLDKDDLERLYDFEEESMEGLVRERDAKQQQSTDERVRLIGERLDGMGSKLEDTYQRSAQQNDNLQSLDFRLMRLEEVAEQTNSSLGVIHRFMAFQRNDDGRQSKSSPNVALTAEDFRRHLTVDPGKRSSCAAFDEDDFPMPTSLQIQTVEPQDLAMLRALGARGRPNLSETSDDAANILQAMKDAKRVEQFADLYDSASSSTTAECPKEDDDVTTRAIASYSSDPGSCGVVADDKEIAEVFDHATEMNDVVDESTNMNLLSTSPQYGRSCSVGAGGQVELRKRFRHWSGTPAESESGFSPRSSRRQQRHKSPPPAEEEKKLCSDCTNRQEQGDQQRRGRLQSFSSTQKWSNVCSNCQMVHSSVSCGNFTAQQPATTPSETNAKSAAIPRSLSGGATRPTGAKVEAEAEHLREIEGQDYQMMEGIIRRRLHRDSEDLDNSLEDLCNAPIPLDETMDSFDEAHEFQQETINFAIGGSLIDMEEQQRQRFGSEHSDVPKRVLAASRSLNPPSKKPEGELGRTVSMSLARKEAEVTINVEEEC